MRIFFHSLLLVLAAIQAFGQSLSPSPENIRKHISYLASDKMKGRGTGSKENKKAAKYVAKQFKSTIFYPREQRVTTSLSPRKSDALLSPTASAKPGM